MKCIQKSNNMWTQCYAQSYKPAETFMPRAGRKKSQGVNIGVFCVQNKTNQIIYLSCYCTVSIFYVTTPLFHNNINSF